MNKQARYSRVRRLGLALCISLARKQKGEICFADRGSLQEDLWHVDPNFGKSECSTNQRAQLKINEELIQSDELITCRVIQFNAIDTQTQYERIDGNLLNAQICGVALSDYVYSILLD